MRKRLPNGLWFSLGNIPPETTEEDVAAFLYELGIQVDTDRIAVTTGRDAVATAAIVSLPHDEVERLFGRGPHRFATPALEQLIGDNELLGRQPRFFVGRSCLD
jgi:hypothetical protein